MTRWICGAATRRSALSSETLGGGVLLALSFETEQLSMAEDRYPSFFPKFATERSKEMCLWMVDWAMPDIFWDLQKARIFLGYDDIGLFSINSSSGLA